MAFSGNYVCDSFKTGLIEGDFNFGLGTSDVYKIALYTSAATLNASTTGYTTSNEVSASGYTAGGNVLTPAVATASGVAYVDFLNSTWNSALTARGVLIYKYDGSTNPAICVLDFGTDLTSSSTFTVEFPPDSSTTAIIRLL